MRIRTIKPEFFTHEGLFDLEKESGLPIRLAFAGLWCASDREGRFRWEPRRLGVSILPYDGVEFSRVLDALITRGFVIKYRVGNDDFGAIPSFPRHQVINNREKESILPEPPPLLDSDACLTRESRVADATLKCVSGREGNMEGERNKEGNACLLSSETYVSSPPTVTPEEAGRQAAPNFSEKEEEPEALPSIPTETAFLSAARKMGIPEAYAVVAYAELVGRGWKTADGSPVVSFAAVLKAGWDREQAKPSRANPGEPRKREPWMVEADIKRVKAEVKRITDDPASRYASKGYSATWEQHQDQFREAWLAVVRACHDEMREKLPEDFRAFEASLAEAREEMRKGAAMLGQDPGAADSEDVRLMHFVTFFPEDCPDFARWDREWNRAKSWRDPKGLTEDAKTEIKILKGQLSALENERRALLVNAG